MLLASYYYSNISELINTYSSFIFIILVIQSKILRYKVFRSFWLIHTCFCSKSFESVLSVKNWGKTQSLCFLQTSLCFVLRCQLNLHLQSWQPHPPCWHADMLRADKLPSQDFSYLFCTHKQIPQIFTNVSLNYIAYRLLDCSEGENWTPTLGGQSVQNKRRKKTPCVFPGSKRFSLLEA